MDPGVKPHKLGPGNKYFSCFVENQFHKNGTVTNPCEPKAPGGNFDSGYNIYYTLEDHDGFYNELLEKYGIVEEWVTLGEREDKRTCEAGGAGCASHEHHFYGYPVPSGNVTVNDPSEILSKGFDTFTTLQDTILGHYFAMRTGDYAGYLNDPMEVLVMPASLAVQASEAMVQVAKIGQKEIEEEKKTLIITILSAVLFALPFVGEGFAVAGGTILISIGRIITFVGAAGDSALSAYTIYEDPKNAPIAIFSILTDGAGGLGRTPEQMSHAGGIRRGMPSEDVPKLGTVFKENDDLVRNMVKYCRKK